jgi:hypothetical protein
MSQYSKYPVQSGGGVTSLNGLTGDITLAAGTNITLVPVGNTVTINSSNSGGTVTSVGLSTPGVVFNVSGSPVTSSGTLALTLINQTGNTVFASPSDGSLGAPLFRSLVAADIPSISLTSGVSGVLPIANGGTGQASANAALNALLPDQSAASTKFLQSDGVNTLWAAIAGGTPPSASQTSTSVVTAASTTFVTALTASITLTQTAQIWAVATADIKATSAAAIAQGRIVINGVAGQLQSVSLLNTTDHYDLSTQAISSALAPGTYTVTFQINRLSGTGTVNFFQGTLVVDGLQGANSNGITQLTGDVTTAAGSGSQAATIAAGAVTGSKIASATITSSNIASATITGSNIAAATILNANISTVDAGKITTGTLPLARGGTGATAFANQRIPFSNGTNLLSDALFVYDTTNNRFNVGGFGTATGNFVVTSGSKTALQAFNQSAGNAFQATNVSAYTAALISRQNNATSGASIGFEFGRGTPASPSGALSGDFIGTIVATPDAASGSAFGYCGSIAFIASENATTTATGGDLVLATTPNGTLLPIERVRVKNSGESVFAAAIATAQFTTVQKNALTPAAGWVVFDTTLNQLSYYNGTIWVNL